MALMNWDETFSVGVKEIDLQHQKLMAMINKLHDAMKLGKGSEILGSLLGELIDYAHTHFSNEEKYFKKFNYEQAATHEVAHHRFTEKVLNFQADFNKGNTDLSIDIMNFLKDWLTKHIKGVDKQYTKCFNEHGLK